MNRIRELREALGISRELLAERVGTSAQQIGRLETGARRLTVDWMQSIAGGLECSPADLIENVILAQGEPDVEAIDPAANEVAAAIAKRGLRLYRVLRSQLTEINVNAGDVITVDETPESIMLVADADVVLVQMGDPLVLVLRQYLRPSLIVTNRPGLNIAVRTTDRSVAVGLRGVVLRH